MIIMKFRVVNDLNIRDIRAQAEELGISVWKTPSFLFLLTGLVAAMAMVAVYHLTKFYNDPLVIFLAENISIVVIFSLGRAIIYQFEQVSKLNQAKNEFISVASHQLRTPLSSMRWQIELLLKKFGSGLSEKQREGIEGIERLSLRMTRLVNDLLDVTRIDQKRLYLKCEPVNLVEITEEIVKDLLSLARAKNIEIIFNHKPGVPQVLVDKGRMGLVIENLLSNAVKYTLAKGRVEIDLYQRKNQVLFSVKDNGVGIPENQQKYVFEKFFRSNNVLKYQTEGTGLGLYIVKNVIEQLGGEVGFESEEGKGSTFTFSLPIARE
jgi:signal transduction histidine kinase